MNVSSWRDGTIGSTNGRGSSGQGAGSAWLKHSAITVVIVVILAGGSYGGWWYYTQHVRPAQQARAVGVDALQSVSQVVAKVSDHMLLPSGEQPTLATVSDINKVKGQAFFAHAANGDKVLVYAQAKKAILYRPSIDRVIETAPLSTSTSNTSSSNDTKSDSNQTSTQPLQSAQ
jgi:hypothetical protein